MFHFYGRRTNRFLLLNYGFVLQDNKYNSITLRVSITLNKYNTQNPAVLEALGLE